MNACMTQKLLPKIHLCLRKENASKTEINRNVKSDIDRLRRNGAIGLVFLRMRVIIASTFDKKEIRKMVP